MATRRSGPSAAPRTGGAAPSRQPLEDLGRGEQCLVGCWCADEDAKIGCAAGRGCVGLGLGFLFFLIMRLLYNTRKRQGQKHL